MTPYRAPTKIDNRIRYIGFGMHMSWQIDACLMLVHMNSDVYKAQLQSGLVMDREANGAVTLFVPASLEEHRTFAWHLTAEEQVEDFEEGRGTIVVYRLKEHRSANHYLDAAYAARCAGEFVRTETERWEQQGQPEQPEAATFAEPDGRPYLLTERQ